MELAGKRKFPLKPVFFLCQSNMARKSNRPKETVLYKEQ